MASVAPHHGTKYPVAVGPTRRYLVDANGAPVLVCGDAAWSMVAAARREDVVDYLDDCVEHGFNAVIVNLLEAYFSPDPPRSMYGEGPFTTPGDFGTPNEPYFAYVDWILGEAEKRDILVFLCPTYLGHRSPHGYAELYGHGKPEGWHDEVLANGVEGCRAFGGFIGARFKRFTNLVWMLGGDRDPGDVLEHVRAMASGIQAVDPAHLLTVHVQPEGTPSVEYPDDPWLTVNFTYSYQLLHFALLRDYLRTPAMPNIMVEASYEFDHNSSQAQIRRQMYWSALCGATGHFMGTLGVFDFAPGWRDLLASPGRQAQRHFAELLSGYPWWDLVPDLSRGKEYAAFWDPGLRPLVVEGVGELRGNDFCSAARTPDGSLAMFYLPTGRRISVDLSQMAGPLAEAVWFDPRSGERIPGGLWRTEGVAALWPPTPEDWVLVITGPGR